MAEEGDVAKPKRVFLKRGEGVQKRVFGPQIKKQRDVDDVDNGLSAESSRVANGGEVKPDVRRRSRDQVMPVASTQGWAAWTGEEDDMPSEVPGQTSMMQSVTRNNGMADTLGGKTSHSASQMAAGRQHDKFQEDLELAEFEALEEQIRKDLGQPTIAPRATHSAWHGHAAVSHAPARQPLSAPIATAQAGASHLTSANMWAVEDEIVGSGTPDAHDPHVLQETTGNSWADTRPLAEAKTRMPAAKAQETAMDGHYPGSEWWQVDQLPVQPPHQVPVTSQQPTRSSVPQPPSEFEDDTEEWGPQVTAASGGGHGRGFSYQSSTLQWFENNGAASEHDLGRPQGGGQQEQEEVSSCDPVHSPELAQPFVRSLFGANHGSAGRSGPTGNQQQRGRRDSNGGPGAGRGKGGSAPGTVHASGLAAADMQRLQHLEQENSKLQQERVSLGKLRTDLERAASRLEAERAAWERKQATDGGAFEAWRAAEVARLERDRRVLDKQSKAILKLPTKKERSAVEAVEAVLEEERKEGRAVAARHKLTVERLRRQLLDQQEKNRELREEIRWHEAQRLTGAPATTGPPSVPGRAGQQHTPAAVKRTPSSTTTNAGAQVDMGSESLARVQLKQQAEQLLPYTLPPRPAAAAGPAPAAPAARSQPGTATNSRQQPAITSSQPPVTNQPSTNPNRHQPLPLDSWAGEEDETALDPETGPLHVSDRPSHHSSRGSAHGAYEDGEYMHGLHGAQDGSHARWDAGERGLSGDMGQGHLGHVSMRHGTASEGRKSPPEGQQQQGNQQHWQQQQQQQQRTNGFTASDDVRSHQEQQRPSGKHVSDSSQPSAGAHGSAEGGDDLAQLGSTLRLLRVEREAKQQGYVPYSHQRSYADMHQQPQTSRHLDSTATTNHAIHHNHHYQPSLHPVRSHDEELLEVEASFGSRASDHVVHVGHGHLATQAPMDATQHSNSTVGGVHHTRTHSSHSLQHTAGMHQPHGNDTQQSKYHDHHSLDSHQANGHHHHNSNNNNNNKPSVMNGPNQGPRGMHATNGQGASYGHAHHTGKQEWLQSAEMVASHQVTGSHTSHHVTGSHTSHHVTGSHTSHHHASRDPVVRSISHADGKVERFRASGRRDVSFANGTRKVVLTEGTTLIRFANGDIKHQLSSGCTEYFYAEVGTWHTSYTDGTEVFHFPSGQAEAHHPHGTKEVVFPDGAARQVTQDGVEIDMDYSRLCAAVTRPCPSSMMQHMVDEEEPM